MIWNENGYQLSGQLGPVIDMENPLRPWETQRIENPFASSVNEIGSFEQYCISHYGCDWLTTIREAVGEGTVPIGKKSWAVGEPDCRFVSEAEFIRVEFSRLDRQRFYADAIIAACIDVSANRDGELVRDTIRQWYRLRNLFTVLPNGHWVETEGISIYEKRDSDPGLPLSKYLVPVLNQEEIEQEANDLLLRFYPEAFLWPIQLNPDVLAERMGLTILDVALAGDENLMGQAIFYDCLIDTLSDGAITKLPVRAGTILVNSRCQMNSIQRATTIIHECCHHYEHDLFVWAQKLWQSDIAGIRCPVAADGDINSDSPLCWAERQARMMAYCVKMNRIQVTRQARQFIDGYEQTDTFPDMGRQMEDTVHHIADTFQTSRECARNRLIELGYSEMRGVLNYVNGGYIPPYFYAQDALSAKQTFVVSLQDALTEFSKNEAFRNIVKTGFYVYVEGKFCLNQPKYVETDPRGVLRMTNYGRWHTEECCLRFDVSYKGRKLSYVWGRFNRDGRATGVPANASEPGRSDAEAFQAAVEWATTTNIATAPMDFSEALCFLMDKREMSLELLEEKSMLSARTIKRLRGDPDYNVTREHIVAVAVGLHLPPMVSLELMRKAGLVLKNTKQHNTYMMILCTMYQTDIHIVNSFLEAQNFSPLTKLAAAM